MAISSRSTLRDSARGSACQTDTGSADRLTSVQKRRLTLLSRDLRSWSQRNGRSFPWRTDDTSTYEAVVVEVLLQRTTATAVSRFYERFFERFSNWESLAAANEADLEEFLKPLGLWRRRAASLVGLARYAAARRGVFPSDPREHVNIPAVGQYVSNAILLFQEGKPAPLLDVNMARVVERFLRPRRLADIRYDPWLQEATTYLVRRDPVEVNWAALDFAALVCKARMPLCDTCPVMSRCAFPRREASSPTLNRSLSESR